MQLKQTENKLDLSYYKLIKYKNQVTNEFH